MKCSISPSGLLVPAAARRRAPSLRRLAWLVALAVALAADSGWPGSPARPRVGAPARAKLTRTALTHLDTALDRLHQLWRQNEAAARRDASLRHIALDADRVRIGLIVVDPPAAEAAEAAIAALGGETIFRLGAVLEAWVPVSALDGLHGIAGIRLAHRIIEPVNRPAQEPQVTRSGEVESQGVAASNASLWHDAGFTGQGVSVAIIGSFAGWEQAQVEGELPAFNLSTFGELDLLASHGTACAEVIYDMAPDASLTLASASGYVAYAQAVIELAGMGYGIIASSLAPVEPGPGDGTGVLADAIASARNLHDVVFVQAAGDLALQHWEGAFTDSDGDDVHEFGGSEHNRLGAPSFVLAAGQRLTLQLSWNDWPASDQDFDLYLHRWSGSEWVLVDASENYQTGTEPPWEYIDYPVLVDGSFAVTIERWEATTAPFFDLLVHTADVPLEFHVRDRSLDQIAAAPAAISVGAVEIAATELEDSSSWGPTYGPGGTPDGGHDQPRLAGFSGVDSWSLGDGGFRGTTAAGAHVAGAAALVRGAFPEHGATELQDLLEGLAVDGGQPGYDHGWGFGRLWLGDPPAECAYSLEPMSLEFTAAGGDGSFEVATSDGCDWVAETVDSWISITGASAGSGPGTVSFRVDENTGTGGRTGVITVAGRAFTVIQAGAGGGCSYLIAPPAASYPAAGGSGSIAVATDDGCEWTAASGEGWITMTSGYSGSGPGTATYEVSPNPGDARSGTIDLAGETHTVSQAGVTDCSYSISPTSQWFSASGGNGTVEVATNDGCDWSAESNDPEWLHVIDVGAGSGPGAVEYRVEQNSGASRDGSMTIAGLAFVVEQAGQVGEPLYYHIPGVAHLAGVGGSVWRTSLCVTNPSDSSVSLTLSYTTTDSAYIIRTRRLDGRCSVEWEDVATDLFGISRESAGSVEIISRETILISARTYNTTEGGTFGQYMPGLEGSLAIAEGQVGFLPHLRRSAAFRTNIGFQNRTAIPTTVELSLFAADGAPLGELVEMVIPPVAWSQLNDVFIEAGAGPCELGYATVTVTTPGGRIWAYASVVDNRSGDPTTIPLMVP